MKIIASLFFTVLLFTIELFGQSAKKMEQNLNVTLKMYFDPNSTISFDSKNHNKNGLDYMKEEFEKSFFSKGFKIGRNNTNMAQYVFLVDYDYGVLIANYKKRYSNLRGIIIDITNNSQPVGTFSYKGRFYNDKVADAIADKLNTIIIDSSINKK